MFNKSFNPEKIKEENTKLLLKQGIEVVDHLPYIEKNKHRNDDEIAKRTIAMAVLYQLEFGAPKDFISQYLKENGLIDQLTAEETKLLEEDFDDITDQQKVNLSWSVEAIWALTWVCKKHRNLTFNTPVEDSLASTLPDFQASESINTLMSKFKSRPEVEVYKMLDLFYRAHWFARNNGLNGKESDLVNHSIIMERRTALEWVCNRKVAWDEVDLST